MFLKTLLFRSVLFCFIQRRAYSRQDYNLLYMAILSNYNDAGQSLFYPTALYFADFILLYFIPIILFQ